MEKMESDKSPRTPRTRDISLCPCKSLKNYGECCAPYHLGKAKPERAELLMRARYSAYFFRIVEFLVNTTHPDKRTPQLHAEIQAVADGARWQFLTVVATSKGLAEDKTGKVEFIAKYYVNDEPREHHEISRFRRYRGEWKYFDDRG